MPFVLEFCPIWNLPPTKFAPEAAEVVIEYQGVSGIANRYKEGVVTEYNKIAYNEKTTHISGLRRTPIPEKLGFYLERERCTSQKAEATHGAMIRNSSFFYPGGLRKTGSQ